MDRKTILMLPGLLNDATLYENQVSALADVAKCTVGDLTRSSTIADMADDVLAAAPETPFVLVGMSMGGYVALEIMRRAPKRVSALALLDTSARPDTEEATAGREALIARGKTEFPKVVEALLAKLALPDHVDTPEVGSAFQSMAISVGYEVFVQQQRAIIGRPDSRPSLAAIRCPTLIVCGADDSLTPPEVHKEMAEAIPGARLEIIPECGHLSPLEQPDKVTAILRDWLQSLPPEKGGEPVPGAGDGVDSGEPR